MNSPAPVLSDATIAVAILLDEARAAGLSVRVDAGQLLVAELRPSPPEVRADPRRRLLEAREDVVEHLSRPRTRGESQAEARALNEYAVRRMRKRFGVAPAHDRCAA